MILDGHEREARRRRQLPVTMTVKISRNLKKRHEKTFFPHMLIVVCLCVWVDDFRENRLPVAERMDLMLF